MKNLFILLSLCLVSCSLKTNQAQLVHAQNGSLGVDAQCSTHVMECYRLIQNTCQSSYKILFVNYTEGLNEYTITASCNRL